jgi:uracil-DNA glycosylase family 4
MERKVPAEINNPNPGAMLLVGRDPGFNETQMGQPFVGQAGEVLDRTLAIAGLRRKDINIINRVPWRPPNNDFSQHPYWAVADGLVELNQTIRELRPGLILAMGNEANYDLVQGWPGETIYGAKGIQDRRGYFWEDPTLPCPVLSTIHPALVLYQTMPNKMLLEIDMLRSREYLLGNLPITHFPDSYIARHPKDLLPLVHNDLVAYDIEVTWGGSRLLCIAFYGENMDRPIVVMERDYDWCVPFLESDTPKVAHNGQFDLYFLQYRMNTDVRGYVHDTSTLHWAMYPELAGKPETGGEVRGGMTRKSLSFLASQHLNVPWWKEYTNDPVRMAELCGRDVYVTRELMDIMLPEAEEMQCLDQYRTSMSLTPILVDVQATGIKIDEELRKKRMKELSKRQSILESSSRSSALSWIESAGLESFKWTKQCPCCGGGKIARDMCWRCAGFKKKPGKKELEERLRIKDLTDENGKKVLKADLERLVLTTCQECSGTGILTGHDFNPMSPKQMVDLLYGELRVPKFTYFGDTPNASEETMKRILEWASE